MESGATLYDIHELIFLAFVFKIEKKISITHNLCGCSLRMYVALFSSCKVSKPHLSDLIQECFSCTFCLDARETEEMRRKKVDISTNQVAILKSVQHKRRWGLRIP